MASFELAFSVEVTVATKAYRKFIREGCTHLEACYQLDTMILPKLKDYLSKNAFHDIVDRLRKEPTLSRWYEYPLNGGCPNP